MTDEPLTPERIEALVGVILPMFAGERRTVVGGALATKALRATALKLHTEAVQSLRGTLDALTLEGFIQLGVAAQKAIDAILKEHSMTEDTSGEFQFYQRTQVAEMRPWRPGEAVEGISISEADKAAGSPKEGDMIARNPSNHDDQWLVSAAYFAANFQRDPRG